EVINTRDVVTFQGVSVQELRKAFRESVEDYLDFCAERDEEPEKPLSGQYVTRISPDLHRRINIAACVSGKSHNSWVTEQLEKGGARGQNLPDKTSHKTRSGLRTKLERTSSARRDSAAS